MTQSEGLATVADLEQNLVWSGFGPAGGGIFHNFHICPINGTNYLCFFNGNQFPRYARGHGVVLDSSLSIALSVQHQGGLAANDEHELNVWMVVTPYS